MNRNLIKSAFANDPEVLRALEARQHAEFTREILREALLENEVKIEFIKGVKGETGDTRTDEEVRALIAPLIPEPIKGEDGFTPIKGVDYKDGIDGHTPTKDELLELIKPLIPKLPDSKTIPKTEIVREELTVTEQLVKDIIKMMHKLPESDKLEVSKGIRNAQSFIYKGTKYGVEELMHGGGSSSSSSSGYQVPTSGVVNGSNQVFVWATAPSVIVVDQGRAMQKTSSDGTVNWTGTLTTTLTVAPTFDIYATA